MTKKGIRSWLSLMLSVLLALMSVAPALAAETPQSQDPDIAMLQSYGIVKGDGSGSLKLDTTITRAELATIAVRAMGAEELSSYFENSTIYSDMGGRFAWANRYAAMANSLGAMKGRGNGTFDPGSDITNGEVFAVLLRLVEREPQGEWNPQLIMSVATQVGIAEGPTDVMANLPAYRGAIFKALAKAMTRLQLADGNTALRKYIDKTAPVLSVDAVPTTANATVTVTGTANGATSVTVNGQAATLNGTRFTANVTLTSGANTVAVAAKDAAGNTATQNITITRASNASKIEVTGTTSVKPGETTTIRATAYDASNRALPADAVTARLSGNIGTYNAATGVFTAGSTAGSATLTFTSGSVTKTVDVIVAGLAASAEALRIRDINTSNSVGVGKTTTVKVEVVNADDELLDKDNGRAVTLSITGIDGVTISPTIAYTIAGIATFTITGRETGDGTLAARSSGLTSGSIDLFVGSGTHVVLTATPKTAPADGVTDVDIQATLENESGDTVSNNSNSDIDITLSGDSNRDATLSGSHVTIPRGRTSSSSGATGTLTAGKTNETVKVDGRITSGQSYAVVPVSVTFSKTAVTAASRFEISGTNRNNKPGDGDIRLTVEAVDKNGAVIGSGNYAFQVEVSTTNKEDLTDGLPDGLSLTISGKTPVKGAKDAVIARTVNGQADIRLAYDKSGSVTLKIVGVAETNEAVDDSGDVDKASSGKSLANATTDVRFLGTASKLLAKVDLTSAKLYDQPYGVLSAATTSSATIKVYATDAKGGWVSSYNGYVELTGGGTYTERTTRNRVQAVGGVAQFTLTSKKTDGGVDTYTATSSLGSSTIDIMTSKVRPAYLPEILSIHGNTSADGRVSPADTSLMVELSSQPGEYGYVKVIRGSSKSGTLVYTSPVMDLSDSPVVHVPKSLLTTGAAKYLVVINNGAGDSDISQIRDVTTETPVTVNISKVRFSAGVLDTDLDTLIVTASGVTSAGVVDPTQLFLRVPGQPGSSIYDLDANIKCTTASGSFTCKLAKGSVLASEYSGRVILDTAAGWYRRDKEGQAADRDDDTSNNYVAPMAVITGATVQTTRNAKNEVTGATVTLSGVNLDQNIYPSKLFLKVGTAPPVKLNTSTTQTYMGTSTKATITVPVAIAQDLAALSGSIALNADPGWLKISSDANAPVASVSVHAAVPISTVRFIETAGKIVINGAGLIGGDINVGMLHVKTSNGRTEWLDLGGVGVVTQTILHDTSIELVLSTTAAAAIKSHKGQVYLVSEPTDGSSWFTTQEGWLADDLLPGKYPIGW